MVIIPDEPADIVKNKFGPTKVTRRGDIVREEKTKEAIGGAKSRRTLPNEEYSLDARARRGKFVKYTAPRGK